PNAADQGHQDNVGLVGACHMSLESDLPSLTGRIDQRNRRSHRLPTLLRGYHVRVPAIQDAQGKVAELLPQGSKNGAPQTRFVADLRNLLSLFLPKAQSGVNVDVRHAR